MKVEFELNGKKQTSDLGLVTIYEYSASSRPDEDEMKEKEKIVVHEIGDIIDVYVDGEGQVYLASVVDRHADGSSLKVAGAVIGITTLLVALPIFFKRKRRA